MILDATNVKILEENEVATWPHSIVYRKQLSNCNCQIPTETAGYFKITTKFVFLFTLVLLVNFFYKFKVVCLLLCQNSR